MLKGCLPLIGAIAASASSAQMPTASPSGRALIAGPAKPADRPDAVFVQQDTPIRLMVLNEVSTRTARPGDRFVLRVDEPVVVEGVTIVPVGAKAWGEVLSAERSGHVGKAGKLAARLLSVEIGGQQVPISGETTGAGEKGTTQVALGAFGLGPLALLAPGNNAKLKAGEIFSAYFTTDLLYDRATATISALPAGPAKQ